MSTPIQPWTFLVVAVAGWIQRDQQAAIVYLLEENRVLKARLHGRKLRFTDDERRLSNIVSQAVCRRLAPYQSSFSDSRLRTLNAENGLLVIMESLDRVLAHCGEARPAGFAATTRAC